MGKGLLKEGEEGGGEKQKVCTVQIAGAQTLPLSPPTPSSFLPHCWRGIKRIVKLLLRFLLKFFLLYIWDTHLILKLERETGRVSETPTSREWERGEGR